LIQNITDQQQRLNENFERIAELEGLLNNSQDTNEKLSNQIDGLTDDNSKLTT